MDNENKDQAAEEPNVSIEMVPATSVSSDISTGNNEKQKWVDTKKDYDIDVKGSRILSKVTTETETFRRKERLDLLLKLLPLLAVLASVFLFYFQQKNENDRRKKLFALDTYTNTTTIIQKILAKRYYDSDIEQLRDEFFYSQYPRIQFIGDSLILIPVDSIRKMLPFYINSLKLFAKAKTMIDLEMITMDSVKALKYDSLFTTEDSTYIELGDTYLSFDSSYKQFPEIVNVLSAARSMHSMMKNINDTYRSGKYDRKAVSLQESRRMWSAFYMSFRFLRKELARMNDQLVSTMIISVRL